MKMMKKKICFPGVRAQKILLVCLPLMILAALLLTVYVARMDGTALIRSRETVWLFLETMGRALVCLSLGCVLADLAENICS